MDGLARELAAAAARWDERGWPRPHALLVSGSGLGVDLGPAVAGGPLQEWLPFAASGIEGHPLSLEIFLPASGRPILYQRGRIHSYQGHDAHRTVFAVRLAAELGAHFLVMTNAAGALRPRLRPGDLVLIGDHLNLTGLNPLAGEIPAEWGPRFPDLSAAYDPELRRRAQELAVSLDIPLDEGIYAGVAGPSYETPAEVEMLRRLGADLVGMSTVLEVIAARHRGMRCLCLSLVSNLAAGVADGPLHHAEVLDAGREAAGRLRRLLGALLAEL